MGKQNRTPYRRKSTKLPPLVFDVETENGTATLTAEHLKLHELAGLADAFVGETNGEADPTGLAYLRERIFKLGRVTIAVDTGDPDDPDLAACRGDFAKFYRLEGNENL